MNEWIDELSDFAATGERAVLVTVAGIRGSAPREIGAKMIVTAADIIGTIGGGQLEYQSTRIAVEMLEATHATQRSFPLGSSMGQCCGGVVEILFEPVTNGLPDWLRDLRALYGQHEPAIVATRISKTKPAKFVASNEHVYGCDEASLDPVLLHRARQILQGDRVTTRDVQELYEPIVAPNLNIAVFGAGHVGSAVIQAIANLDCTIRWVDSRRRMFRQVPANVRAVEATELALEVAAMPPNSFYLVMTHSHAMDFEICERILMRSDVRYCGLIGSKSKRRRFEKRYRQQGMPQETIERLICPIGVNGISGKKPAEIAVSVAAEILKRQEHAILNQASQLPTNVHRITR